MTLLELKTILASTTFPVAYRSFAEATTLPCICYFETGTNNFGADNKVYKVNREVAVELYTKNKDVTSEATLEGIFDTNEIFWEKEETYLDDEKCYEIIYTIEI